MSAVDCIKMCSVINLLFLSSLHAATLFHMSSVMNLIKFVLLLCAATRVSMQNMQSDVFLIFAPLLSTSYSLILRQESITPYNIKEREREREGGVCLVSRFRWRRQRRRKARGREEGRKQLRENGKYGGRETRG